MIYLIAYIAPNERVCSETFEANTQEQAIKIFREQNKGIYQLLAVTEMKYDSNYTQGDYGGAKVVNIITETQKRTAEEIKNLLLYKLKNMPLSVSVLSLSYNQIVAIIDNTIDEYIREISDNVRKV